MKVGSLVMVTNSDNKQLVGTLGIATEEYRMEGKTYFVVLFSNGRSGRGWTYDSWGMEVLCE